MRSARPALALLCSCSLLLGCGSSPPRVEVPQAAPRNPPEAMTDHPSTEPHGQKENVLSGHVYAWVRLGDGTPLVAAAAQIAGVALPAREQQEPALRALLARLLGLDARAAAGVDLRRPAALVAFDPTLAGEGMPPLVVALPIASREAFVEGLQQAGLTVEPRGEELVVSGQAHRAFVGLHEGYALVAFREELAGGAWAALGPVLERATEAPLVLHVDVARLYARFGPQLALLLGRFVDASREAADPQVAYALRGVRRLAGLADGITGLDVLVGADAEGLELTARLDGGPSGAPREATDPPASAAPPSGFARYVAEQRPGPTWGLRFVPADAVLVYATRRVAPTADEEVDATVTLLGDAARPPVADAVRERWREALRGAVAQMSGELVYAVWPGQAGSLGGIGIGGAWRVREAEAAQQATRRAYLRVGGRMGGLIAQALRLDPARFRLQVAVRPGAYRLGAVPVDVVQVAVRWPAGSGGEQRAFRALFGERLELVTAFVGEQALFAAGQGARARLATLVAIAQGDPRAAGAPSLEHDPRYAGALAFAARDRVSWSCVSTQGMARLLARMLRVSSRVDRTQMNAVDDVLAQAGNGYIVAATSASQSGQSVRYQLSTRFPASSLPGLSRVGTVLWRMALSPLLNPPAIPPLPLPPAHVTAPPPAAPRNDASTPSRHL